MIKGNGAINFFGATDLPGLNTASLSFGSGGLAGKFEVYVCLRITYQQRDGILRRTNTCFASCQVYRLKITAPLIKHSFHFRRCRLTRPRGTSRGHRNGRQRGSRFSREVRFQLETFLIEDENPVVCMYHFTNFQVIHAF